jgi:hypothetical protein
MAPITEITEEQWDAVINLNLKSAFLCAKAVAPVMMEKKSGRIINIASQSGIGPNPHAPSYLPYGAAKAGMIGFSKTSRQAVGAVQHYGEHRLAGNDGHAARAQSAGQRKPYENCRAQSAETVCSSRRTLPRLCCFWRHARRAALPAST